MKTNSKGIDLIKSFEGFQAKAYVCPAGKLTIGYGHVILKGEEHLKTVTLTQTEAEALLRYDLKKTEDSLNKLITYRVNENQFSACVSLAYNIGVGNFGNSTLLKRLNEGNLESAALEFLRWCKVNGNVSNGLMNRRKKESKLFSETIV